MVAQRGAGIGLAIKAAALKLRNNEVDEVVERARIIGRHDVEPISRALNEPLLERIGDRLRGTAQDPVSARRGGEVVEVAQ